MQTAKIVIDPDFWIGEVDPRLYGSFIEHLGRAVYGGIYEPGHPTADEMGFRRGRARDGARAGCAVRPLSRRQLRLRLRLGGRRGTGGGAARGASIWPGGRSRRTRSAPTSSPPGPERAGAEVILAVNLGTGGIDEARNLVEYCNHPGGSYWSDLRRSHGVSETARGQEPGASATRWTPPGRFGHKTAEEYGRLACETAIAMKWVDPAIELVACGSSHGKMPTFPQWESDGARPRLRVRRLPLAAHLRPESGRRPRHLPGPIAGDGRADHRDGHRHLRFRQGQEAARRP